MQRAVASIVALVVVGTAAIWMTPGEREEVAKLAAPVGLALQPMEPEQAASGEGAAAVDAASVATGSGAVPPPGMTEAQAERQRRLQQLQEAADARFKETVQLDGLRPADIEPSVRELLRTVKLEPVFDLERGADGYINGMQISKLIGTSPFAAAGFRLGDRLTRINGEPLVDPAQIAHLFAQLGERFEVCAARDGGEHCRMVVLEKG